MPIYEYLCRDCNHPFEVLTTSSAADDTVQCPECKGQDVTKTISATNFRMGAGSSIPTGGAQSCPSRSGFS